MAITINFSSALSSYYKVSSLVSSPTTSFSAADSSGDGKIDTTELTTYLDKTATTANSADVYDKMDTDGDGSVSEDEYTTYADLRTQQLESILSTQQTMQELEVSLVQSAKISTDDSSTKSSSTTTANKILSQYTQNMTTTVSDVLGSIDVEA